MVFRRLRALAAVGYLLIKSLVGLLVELAGVGKFYPGLVHAAHGAIEPRQPPMHVDIVWLQLRGGLQFVQGFDLASGIGVYDAQIEHPPAPAKDPA